MFSDEHVLSVAWTTEAIHLRWGSARGILINVQPLHIVKVFFSLLTIVNS